MKRSISHRHNGLRAAGRAAAIFATAAFLTVLPLVSSAQKQDKDAKPATGQATSNGSFVVTDTATINSHRRDYEAQLRKRGIAVMPVLNYAFSVKFPAEIQESFTMNNPKGECFCVLIRQELERLQQMGNLSITGRVLVLGKDGTIHAFERQ